MADTSDQTVPGSTCMKYRREGRGVLLLNNCDQSAIFAVVYKSSSAGGGANITKNVEVSAKSREHYPTGGSENVTEVGIGSL